MSWRAVARKDFRDARRSRALWGLSVLFVALSVLVAVAFATVDLIGGPDPSPTGLVTMLAGAVGTFVSLAAVITCYRSLAGERESGSVKILLALPHSRGEALLGKLLGRTAVLAIPVLGGLLIGVVVGSALLGAVAALPTVALLVVTLVFTLAYVSIVVGLSATTGTATRAATLAVAFFVVVELFWDVFVLALVYAASGFAVPTGGLPDWTFLLNQVPPTSSFVTTMSLFVPGSDAAAGAGGAAPFYLTPWVGVFVLAVWIVLPALLGYARFSAADL